MTQSTPLNYGFAGNSKYGQYYQHSGQINVSGVVAAMGVGIPAGIAMGIVYSAAVVFIPYIKLRFLICLLYGMGLGAVPAGLLKKLKVRNVSISLAVVGIVTLISFYFSWASWESFVMRDVPGFPSFTKIVTNPEEVRRIAGSIYDFGTWSMQGAEAMKETNLLIIWGIEALLVFGISLLTVRTMLHQTPFCEKCDQWCSGPKVVRVTAQTDVALLKTKLEAGDFAYVAGLPEPASGRFLEFNQHRCEKCTQLNTLSVVSRAVVKDKKGRVKTNKTTTVVNKLLVSADDLALIMPATAMVSEVVKTAPAAPVIRKPLQSPQKLK